MITIDKAVALRLGMKSQPVVTAYQLGLTIWRLYISGKFQGEKLRIKKDFPEKRNFSHLIDKLQDNGIITERKDFPRASVFDILGKEHRNPDSIACTVDPFAYISHLSALSYHGLTDRNPRMLFISSPAPKTWRLYAQEKMKKDIGDEFHQYILNKMPRLTRIDFTKIGRQPVNRFASLHLGAFKSIKESPVRIATIGRTFLDMLRKPDLCGGIHHVLDIFKKYAEQYITLIINEFDQHGSGIDKVRAGYVLEERCGIRSTNIEKWLEFVQRGGSRKLDSTEEYSPNFSERWCLSLNID